MSDPPGVKLSVVVLAGNRPPNRLRACLEALAEQSADPAGFEVIVASRGELGEALEAAAGPACLLLDAAVRASPQLVAEHLAAHREDRRAFGLGPVDMSPGPHRDWFGRARAEAWNERFGGRAAGQAGWYGAAAGNFSAPLAALRDAGRKIGAGPTPIELLEIASHLDRTGLRPRRLPRAGGVREDGRSRAEALAETAAHGAACARLAERLPATRPRLLGWFLDTSPREVLLRRLLLAPRLPPAALARLGAAVPGAARRRLWFDFVWRYAFWLGVRSAMSRERWLGTTRGVPVLMYHGFTEVGERDRYVLSSRSFARQMRLLRLLRRRVVSFEELVASLREGRPLPPRSVVVTIDDGYRDNFELAYPILRRHRFPATIFLVSGRLGGRNDWGDEGAVADRPILTVDQVRRMRADGIEFGAHTRSHPSLPDVGDREVSDQIAGSRQELEGELGEPVKTFAYPYGRFDERAVEAVGAAGFAGACTVEGGLVRPNDDPRLVPRIEVRGEDPAARLLLKVWLGRT